MCVRVCTNASSPNDASALAASVDVVTVVVLLMLFLVFFTAGYL